MCFFSFGSLTMAQHLKKTFQNHKKSPHSYRLMPGFTYMYIVVVRCGFTQQPASADRSDES